MFSQNENRSNYYDRSICNLFGNDFCTPLSPLRWWEILPCNGERNIRRTLRDFFGNSLHNNKEELYQGLMYDCLYLFCQSLFFLFLKLLRITSKRMDIILMKKRNMMMTMITYAADVMADKQ